MLYLLWLSPGVLIGLQPHFHDAPNLSHLAKSAVVMCFDWKFKGIFKCSLETLAFNTSMKTSRVALLFLKQIMMLVRYLFLRKLLVLHAQWIGLSGGTFCCKLKFWFFRQMVFRLAWKIADEKRSGNFLLHPKYVMQTLLLLLAAALRLAVAVMQHHYSFEDRETCSFVVLLCSYERYTQY